MATATHELEPAWLEDELWVTKNDGLNGVTLHAPDQDAREQQQAQRAEPQSFRVAELLLAVCFGLPQLAWMGFLAYVGLRVMS